MQHEQLNGGPNQNEGRGNRHFRQHMTVQESHHDWFDGWLALRCKGHGWQLLCSGFQVLKSRSRHLL